MSYRWTFKEAAPGDRARESQVEKFFNSDAVSNRANAIVREGIQNSLDAAPNNSNVKVRISVSSWSTTETTKRLPKYMKGFYEHLNVDSVKAKIPNVPSLTEQFRYLVFEDFGTTGLEGDPKQWWPDEHGQPNPFFNYFRAEGISDKSEVARGRHGVGRLVFMFASRVRSIFGFTRRNGSIEPEELLMGTSVLRNHWLNQKPYLPDGWFGALDQEDPRLTLPVQDDAPFLDEFKTDFSISRHGNNGLSVIVPWLSQDVTEEEIIKSVLIGYYYPILRGTLVVEIAGETGDEISISDQSIDSIVKSQPEDVRAIVEPVIALTRDSLATTERISISSPSSNAPRWDIANISEESQKAIHDKLESGRLAAIHVPIQIKLKGKPALDSHFEIFMRRDSSVSDGNIQFIREGIIISDVRPRRSSGIRALVIVEEGPLASCLGDSENPSHTQWQAELIRDKYTFNRATIDYVVQSVPSILSIISKQQKKPDTSLLIDLFALPSEEDTGIVIKAKKPKPKDGDDTEDHDLDITSKPKSFHISKREGGFTVSTGDSNAQRPESLSIKVAYGVRRGNPFSRYRAADFCIGKGNISYSTKGCSIVDVKNNWLLINIDNEQFEIIVRGFDTNHRDLHVDVKAAMGEAETELNPKGDAHATAS